MPKLQSGSQFNPSNILYNRTLIYNKREYHYSLNTNVLCAYHYFYGAYDVHFYNACYSSSFYDDHDDDRDCDHDRDNIQHKN